MGPPRPSKDDMKSTWRTGDRSKWTHNHWIIFGLGIYPTAHDKPAPVHGKDEKMPYAPQWRSHCWVLVHAAWPLILHQLYVHYAGQNFGSITAFFFYAIAFKLNAVAEFHMIQFLGNLYGYLDGDKHARDEIPDNSVSKIWYSLDMTSWVRPLATVLLTWKSSETPLAMTYWTPFEIGLYSIILDFYFYWYHRAMHETDGLWKYHRTHHLTKHPNPLLTLFADTEQEFFDSIGIPLLTYATMKLLGLPMNFYDWWMCHQYVVYVELIGHSGLRVYGHPPNMASWFLKIFDAELVVEDHDLHHRKGYRQSSNYGKQTRLWDRAFGTCGERIETVPRNVDYENPARVPLF